MTRQAILVITGIVAYQILVWIMASGAADAGISSVEALAVGQTVGLETNVGYASDAISDHCFPGAVALPAKIGDFLGRELIQTARSRIERSL